MAAEDQVTELKETAPEVMGPRELADMAALEEMMAADATAAAAIEHEAGYNWLKIRGKKFTIDGGVNPPPLKAIILLAGFENTFFEDKYNPKNEGRPDCAALGYDEEALAPYVKEPQNDTCKGCPQNKFGTGERGGKACKNQRRLLLIDPDDNSDEPRLYALRVPPDSLKNWGPYVKRLGQVQKAYYAVVTDIGFDEKAEHEKLTFKPSRFLSLQNQDDAKLVRKAIELRKRHYEQFITPFIPDDEDGAATSEAKEEAPKRKPKF